VGVIGNLGVTGDTILRTGVVRIFRTSTVNEDFVFEGGKIYNNSLSLHHNPTTNAPDGIHYIGSGSEDVLSSGNFSYNQNGIISGTWMKVGQVIHVSALWGITAGASFWLPVQAVGSAVISNVNGVAVVDNNSVGGQAYRVVQDGTTNAKVYRDGYTPAYSAGQQISLTFSYLIS
jgi:hypothetical protein